MSYNNLIAMSQSNGLRMRCVAAGATLEGISDPERFITLRWWKVIAHPGLLDAWEAYLSEHEGEDLTGVDLGLLDEVVTDDLVLAAVTEQHRQGGFGAAAEQSA